GVAVHGAPSHLSARGALRALSLWIKLDPIISNSDLGAENMRFMLDPTVAEESPPIPPAPRLGDLASKRLGFVDNSKLNADLFLSRIAAELAGRFGVVVGPVIRKFAPKDYLSKANIAELAKCDAVVQCFGGCGTSTSVSVADAVELERRGSPTITVFS